MSSKIDSLDVNESTSVCLQDLILTCDNEINSINITLCVCSGDSVEGVRIIKKSKNYPICIMPDKTGDKYEVTIHDGDKSVDCLLIGRGKNSDVLLRYNDLTKTWYIR